MADGGEICGQPNLHLIYETLWTMTLYYTKCTISKFWISITVLKLLRALSKSSTRSSDHLNSVFQPVPAAATCSLVLLAILFFIELFRIRILLFVVVFYQSTHALAHRCVSSSTPVEWLHETSWLAGSTEMARFSKMSQHGKTSQLAFSSPHVIVKQFQQSLLLIAVLILKWCRIEYRATNEPAHLIIISLYLGKNERRLVCAWFF